MNNAVDKLCEDLVFLRKQIRDLERYAERTEGTQFVSNVAIVNLDGMEGHDVTKVAAAAFNQHVKDNSTALMAAILFNLKLRAEDTRRELMIAINSESQAEIAESKAGS